MCKPFVIIYKKILFRMYYFNFCLNLSSYDNCKDAVKKNVITIQILCLYDTGARHPVVIEVEGLP